MAGSPNNVTRGIDAFGDEIAAFQAADGARVQAVVIHPGVAGQLLDRSVTAGDAPEEQRAVAASPRRVFHVDVLLATPFPEDRWLMVFNAAAAVEDGANPVWRARIEGGWASMDFGVFGLSCPAGVQVAISTTPGLLTLPGAAEGFFQVGVGVL